MPQRNADPTTAPVQLNIQVSWRYREHLHKLAEDKEVSFSQLVRDALEELYPDANGPALEPLLPPERKPPPPKPTSELEKSLTAAEREANRTKRLRQNHKNSFVPGSWS